jgi:hypothetical protein
VIRRFLDVAIALEQESDDVWRVRVRPNRSEKSA